MKKSAFNNNFNNNQINFFTNQVDGEWVVVCSVRPRDGGASRSAVIGYFTPEFWNSNVDKYQLTED